MPELPEVETVMRGLRKTVSGRTVSGVSVKPTAHVFPEPSTFTKMLTGATFTGFRRRGKNILIDLSNDHTLWVHLKMTGHFYYLPSPDPTGKHDHVIFDFDGDKHTLRFNDYRRFGRLRLFPTAEIMNQPGLAELGPEPLELSADDFVAMCRRRGRMLKPALLDQTFIAGIGNIYADESLYLSRLHPRRLTDSISPRKLRELHGHIQYLLSRAIRLMGTSVDTFTGVNGQPGRFQKYLQVYGREGEGCLRCDKPIRREKIGSRSAHYCPACQRVR
jgi:formamidopyrimidine-DNA glycosylase